MKSLAQARVKRVRAVQLLIEGKSYDQIARAVGYSHRGSAHHAVATALAAREVEAVDELRALEQVRLDLLQWSLWPRAMEGDIAAIDVVLRIIEASDAASSASRIRRCPGAMSPGFRGRSEELKATLEMQPRHRRRHQLALGGAGTGGRRRKCRISHRRQ